MHDLGSIPVPVPYATMVQMNKLRAWAKRNNTTVNVSRYAKDAYTGTIRILSPWNEGIEKTRAKATDLRALMESLDIIRTKEH